MDDEQRLYMLNLFPTVLEADCRGEIRPGLATVEGGAGKRWILELRDGIRLRDGTRVNARDVARCWEAAIARGAGVDSVRVLDDRRIEVFLETPALKTLASPDLALCMPVTFDHAAPESILAVAGVGAGDPRDALTRTALFLSSDQGIADYAEDMGMIVFPLPFDRTYVLLSPSRVASIRSANPPPAVSPEVQRDLAVAIRATRARASETPAWWKDEVGDCGPLGAVPSSMTGGAQPRDSARIVYYDEDDSMARDLAERIVALASMDTTESTTARLLARCLPGLGESGRPVAAGGLGPSQMRATMRNGEGFAFITSIRSPVPDACGSARELLRRAPWLAAGGARLADTVLPLVDASSYVILTSRNIAITWDSYGNVRIVPPPGRP